MASTESQELDWLAYFEQFFRERAEPLAQILDADGCREGWLQGEFFLHGRHNKTGLQTNAGPRKYDLRCDQPPMIPMIAEIKICGGSYSPKMRGLLEADVAKLRQDASASAKFMILVVDRRVTDTPLAEWLMRYAPAHARGRECPLSERVVVRMWELNSAQPNSAPA
jgi:hypothetical protein